MVNNLKDHSVQGSKSQPSTPPRTGLFALLKNQAGVLSLSFNQLLIIFFTTALIGVAAGLLADQFVTYPGEKGTAGLNGTNGKDGVDGLIGLAGEIGPQGLQGGAGSDSASSSTPDSQLSANVALLDRNSQTFTGNNQVFKNATNSTTAFQIQNAAGATIFNTDTVNGRIGIGTSTPTAKLQVAGDTLITNSAASLNTFQVQYANNSALFNTASPSTAGQTGYVISNGIQALGNELQNYSFELDSGTVVGSNGWAATSSTSQHSFPSDSANARSGNRYLKVVGDGATNQAIAQNRRFAVNPGDEIYVEGYVKTTAGTNGQGGLFLSFTDKDFGNTAFANGDWTNPGTSYTLKTIRTTVPAGKYYMLVSATVRNSSTTGEWHFDDFSMTRASRAAPATFKNTADSTTSFQVQNAAGTTLLGVDTSAGTIVSGIADGASAIGFKLKTSSNLTTSGAKLLVLTNGSLGDKFVIDKDGFITTESVKYSSFAKDGNGPAVGSFGAYANGTQTLSGSATVQFNAEHWDISGWYNTSTFEFTPQVKGLYRLSTTVYFQTDLGGFYTALFVYKNGVLHKRLVGSRPSGPDNSLTASALVEANGVDDDFKIVADENTAGSITLFGSAGGEDTFFHGEFVGPRS